MNHEAFKAVGIDIEDALSRVTGNEVLLQSLLKTYAEDDQFSILKDSLRHRDLQRAINACHCLKGMCGNLSMTKLFELFTQQLAYLRESNWDEAEKLMPQIEKSHYAILSAVQNEYLNN